MGTVLEGPVVLRSSPHPELKDRLRSELLALDVNPRVSPTLAGLGLVRFAPEERALRECAGVLGSLPR